MQVQYMVQYRAWTSHSGPTGVADAAEGDLDDNIIGGRIPPLEAVRAQRPAAVTGRKAQAIARALCIGVGGGALQGAGHLLKVGRALCKGHGR